MTDEKLSRRHLLGTSAAAAAAATLAWGSGGSAARAAAPQESPADKPTGATGLTLRWGIIGTGTRGAGTHIPVLKAAPGAQIVALCDVSEERLAAAAARANKDKADGTDGSAARPVATFADYQKLLASPDVDAVVIATPNLQHREMLLAAVQAGKHVLCEKPAGATPADAAAMRQAAAAAKQVVMFGMQYRHNARPRQVRELIAAGRIGTPKYLVQTVSRGDWNTSANVWQYADPKVNGGKPGNWRFSQAATGGTLNEFSCHYFDLLHWMAGGLPERVSADGGIAVYKDGRDTWDHATVTLKYPGGVTAVHTLCMFGPSRNELQVYGDEGTIEMKGDALTVSSPGRRGKGGAKSQEIKPEAGELRGPDAPTLALYHDFIECVRTGKKPDAGADRAIAASRTCWLAELAAGRKAEVRWDEVG